ncbi:MAG: OmpH family outer membrane protein [Micavibrio sp.]|nr:OmpH family outer membrane protein [Micavibrio sp.]
MSAFARIVFLLCLFIPSTLMASEGTKIGVVDVRYIMAESMAAQSILKQRTDLQNKFVTEISETEKKLRDEEQTLLKERESMGQEEFLKKKQGYERKLLDTGRDVREKKHSLEEVLANAMVKVQNKLSDIVTLMAKDRGIDVVINKQSVLVGAESLDMTEEALDKLNKEMPTVKLEAITLVPAES